MSISASQKKKRRKAFGATPPPVIDYLKDILCRYPDGGQILKELIQNADDAGATSVVFIHDERAYGTRTLWAKDLQKYQGPALYTYNNAEFTEDDWQGIQAIGRSIKRDDPNKVGRFGIGFNSVYHVTDLPCIFSGKYLGMLDPQEKIFGEREKGVQWSLEDEEDRETLLTFSDQFQPFRDVLLQVSDQTWEGAVGEDQNFGGTLFRFPLRNEQSEISDTLYDSEKMVQLFDSFIADADISLLFLRSVSSVSLIHIHRNGSVSVRLKVSASSPTGNEVFNPREVLPTEGLTCFKNITSYSPIEGETKVQWLVTTCCMKDGQVPDLDSLAKKLSFRPQVDLAFPLDQDKSLTNGRLSCFLPLPNNETNNTGLPVHVNACFGLTDNRRHIKWQEEDQKFDKAAVWNELLVKEVLPHAYHMIILDTIDFSQRSDCPSSMVYRLWPDIDQMKHKHRWYNVAMDMLQNFLQLNKAVLSLAGATDEWVTLSEAVFSSDGNMESEMKTAVSGILIALGEKLVSIPSHVSRDIQVIVKSPNTLKTATPAFVRNVLHKSATVNVSREDKLWLLEYVLSDGQYHELWGLQLLPVSNGTFKSFTNEDDNLAFIDNEQFPRELLPGWKKAFLPKDLRKDTLHHLRKLAATGTYNKLIDMDSRKVSEYAIKSLPKDWQKKEGHVTWKVGGNQHPPMQWLKDFWKFLNTNWSELSEFIGMPLIPHTPLQRSTSSVMLAKLQRYTTLMFQKNKQNSLSDQMAMVVGKVGGTIIRRDTFLEHQDLETYVLTPSPRNILQLFLNLEKHQVIRGIESTSALEREELKSYLCSLDSLTLGEKGLLSELPLFRSMASLKLFPGEYIAAKSKQAVVVNSIPSIPADLPMTDVVVQCATEADRKLLTLLNMDLLNAAQTATLLVDGIEKRLYKSQEADKIMTWILQHGSILFSQGQALYRKCKDLSFIEIQARKPPKTSSLFDPNNKMFKALFEPDFFPPLAFTRTPQMLESLKRLGLQTAEKNITADNVLHVAKHIEMLHFHSVKKASTKAAALTELLNGTPVLSKFSVQQLRELVGTQWVPCKTSDTVNGDPMTKEKTCFFKPEEMRHSKYLNVVGHAMPLTEKLNENVSEKLGLLNSPPPETVFKNLSALKSTVPGMCDPDTNVHFKGRLHSIYTFLQENISHFRGTVNKKNVLWLWIHTKFVSPCDVVLAYPPGLDLSSYIEKVPEEFLVYKNLLTEFGVRASVSEGEVEGILHRLKQQIDKKCPSYGTPSELKVAIAILNWMREEKRIIKDDLPVPVMTGNEHFNLQPLSSTVFCDISREGLKDLKEDQEVFHVVHGEIPRVTAEWMKIPSLSTRILNPEFIGIEQWGQTEPITLRIKNILKEYDEEKDLFKELIQNAEDAGANACRFMLDFRKHKDPPDTLIDQDMSLCHGPCLWAFNDELFTEEDWKNIVRVGSASKETKVEKIGQFGLGFNAVYHITDIPSVLSGKSILILDPNVTHLKKHIQSKASPGLKLDLFQERLFRRFPGQFQPYQGIFDCDWSRDNGQKFYNGTLIKLPFRTPEEAVTSEISKKVYEKEDIVAFQQHLTKNSQTILLFLRNITEVSLGILPENAPTPPQVDQVNSLLTVSRKVVNTIAIPDDAPLKTMQTDSLKVLLELDAKCEQVIDCLSANIIEFTKKHEDESDVSYWLVHSCFGMQTSLNMFQKGNKQMFSLPVGSIAVPLQKQPKGVNWLAEKSDLVGQVFCFLPLSIHSGLPVHVNGSFSVTSNRKGLWETGVKHEWNTALLKDAVTASYISTLSVLKEMSKKGELLRYRYYTFWPDQKKVSTTFESLTVAFYSSIAQNVSGKAPELFSDGKTWCSIDKARFLHSDVEQNKEVGQIALKEFLAKQDTPYLAVPLPDWVRNSFSKTGFDEIIAARTFDWVDFYQEIVLNSLSSMNTKSRNALVLHAIDMNDKAMDDLLRSHPCIPTEGCENLQFIRNLVNPSGKVACLYDAEEGRFLKGTAEDFCSPKRLHRLSELGMLNDVLSLEDIKERAETIAKIWQQNKTEACQRVQLILELTRDHLNDETSSHWDSIRNTTFIPACPPQITDPNKNSSVTLKKPIEVYSHRCQYQVNMTQTTVDLHSNYYDSVLSKLGVLENPPLMTVLQQLEEAQLHSKALDENMLSHIAYECYEYLDKLEQTQSEAIFERAQSFPFVLIEDTFVNVKSVAKNVEFEAKPYLYCLPKSYSNFKNLWKCVGIQKHFTSEQFVAVLQELSERHESRQLSQCDLNICLTITNELYKVQDDRLNGCFLPDRRGVLHPSHKLCFNDSPWMPVSEDVILCHDLLPRIIALHFGVKSTRHHTLQNHLVAGFSPFVKEFGQYEKLTVRIKNIIAAYPSKKDILKELIQNADDAQATEIHFVWDRRKHNATKTFGEKWNTLQGPALCVYNNKVFSDADLKGIQQLGEGGKHSIQGKTGKYGLGFNSVYHLTDCPSILTGDKWLCISDPNLKYVEGGTKQSPGCMYSLEQEFKESFLDVYNTFLPSDFKLEEGTMFRFPLRTEEMADISEISKNTVTHNDIEELLTALREDPEGLILFLRHIRKIQFHEISQGTDKLRNTFSTELKLSKKCDERKVHFQNHVKKSLDSGRLIEPLQAIYEMDISSKSKLSQWIVAERFGSVSENTDMMAEKCDTRVPQVGVAVCLSESAALEFPGRAFCSLPLPGKTGLPVHVNGNFEVDSSRRDLWKEDGKSMKTEWNESLKLNVIAPLYADLLNYICASSKKVSHSSLYSLELHLDDAYLRFFPQVPNHVSSEWQGTIDAMYKSIDERDLCVIPVLRSSTHQDRYGTRKQYSVTWSSVTKPEPTNVPHFTNNQSFVDKLRFSHGIIHISTSEDKEIFFQTLEDIGMKIVPLTRNMIHISTSFERAHVKVRTINPLTVRDFLKKKPLNDPTITEMNLPLPISQTLIKNKKTCKKLLDYCMQDTTGDKSSTVCGLPLLLTQDQTLRCFHADSPRLLTKLCEVFQGHEEDFADYEINKKHLNVLQKGNFLKEMTIPASAIYLKPILKRFLQNCEVDPHCMLHVPKETFNTWLHGFWEFLTDQIVSPTTKDRKNNQTFLDIKKLFSETPVVPVICPSQNDKRFLKTVGALCSVIPFSMNPVTKILRKLGFMTLDSSFFSDGQLLQDVNRELLNVNDSSAVLDQLYLWQHSPFQQLTVSEYDALILFLQSGLDSGQNTQDQQIKLKSLPLFETVEGKRQRIDKHSVFILKSDLRQSFPALYSINEDTIFLCDNHVNHSLASNVGIIVLNDLEYYVKFILPSLHKLNNVQILNSVQMLLEMKRHPEYKLYHDRIVSSLKGVRFIKDVHGTLQMASYFYDDNVKLYTVMLPKESFVPEQFWDTIGCGQGKLKKISVKQLLKELGLKHVVSDDEMIEFAHQIESDIKGNTSLEELKQKSEYLFANLLERDKLEPHFLDRISAIKFVVPLQIQQNLREYHQPFAGEREFVAIKGSLIEKEPADQLLIWTSVPILPSAKLNLNQRNLLKEAGALDHVCPQHVTENLRNICQAPCKTKGSIQTRADVFVLSYGFLQAVDFDPDPLMDLPLVLVENDGKLVQARQTVLALNYSNEFRPYLYIVPPKLALYAVFFKKIGVEQTPSTQQYSTVLQDIYRDCIDKQEINPNQLKTCKRTVEQLFHLIKATAKQKTLELPQPLYLPARDGRLYESSSLYFNDTFFQVSRCEDPISKKLKLLQRLCKCHLGKDPYEHFKLVHLLPPNVCPTMLSQVITEEMVESSMQECLYGEFCEFSGWFESHLSSPCFMHGLVCLLRQQCSGTVSQRDAVNMCQNSFHKIKIVCCECLETMLVLHQEPLDNTTAESQVYVKRDQEGCTFYLKHSNGTGLKVMTEVIKSLVKEINALLKNVLRAESLSTLEKLLMCDNMEEVQRTLEKNGIRNTANTEDGYYGLPSPGSPIPEEWIDSLDMDFLNNFEKGEYVGFKKLSSEEYIYAIVVEQAKNSLNQGGLCSQKYKIQIGKEEFIQVSTLDLYQFKRETRSSSTVGNSCREIVLLQGAAESAPPPVKDLPQSLEEIKREIDKCLQEIWTLPEEERKKGIRRLYLRWHPDKNLDCTDLATEACAYLQNKIVELQKGGGTGHRHSGTNQGSSPWSSAFRDFFRQWDQEAFRHRRGREGFKKHHSSQQYNFWTFHENRSSRPRPKPDPKPNPEEAQRWHRQAQCDLKAAHNDTGGQSTEWGLFKVHQAVEKALIGAEYKSTGQYSTNGNITSFAHHLSHVSPKLRTLPSMVARLKQLGVDAKTTQYPNYHTSPGIPNDQFNSEDLIQVLDLTSDLLIKIDSYIRE